MAHMRSPIAVVCLILSVCVSGTAAAQQPPLPPRPDAIRVFIDCNYYCEEDYLRREIPIVDYMRDRKDADVHLLVTTQSTGGGGTEYTLKFIGLGPYAGVEHTLKFSALQTATADETRKQMAEVIKRGLIRYIADSPQAARLEITFGSDDKTATKADPKKDPWNLWVFRTNFGGSFRGERSNKGRSIRGSASANRTTDAWKISFSSSTYYSEDTYELSEDETFTSVSRDFDANSTVVKSLTPHWSAGLLGSATSSTYYNYRMRTRIAPGVEYNFFPYSQSTRRMLTVQYTVGLDNINYHEVTIFDKTKETLTDHRLGTTLSLRQPWGTASGQVAFSQYLTHPDKYSISAYGSTNVRLFKGFSFNVYTSLARTRDQIYLPRGAATTEEILVRQHQLATGYRYSVNFGISYSFGSIFNNIVNPRFGGGGDIFFF